MGFFDDVTADLSPDGVLTYTVKEKPYIREVKIQGNSQVTRDKIETALGITARTVLDRVKSRRGGGQSSEALRRTRLCQRLH